MTVTTASPGGVLMRVAFAHVALAYAIDAGEWMSGSGGFPPGTGAVMVIAAAIASTAHLWPVRLPDWTVGQYTWSFAVVVTSVRTVLQPVCGIWLSTFWAEGAATVTASLIAGAAFTLLARRQHRSPDRQPDDDAHH